MQKNKDKYERYQRAVRFLEGLSNLSLAGNYMLRNGNPEIYLKRMDYFLNLIGNPGKHIKFIHIAGTSGKGSVANMVHEILLAAGNNIGSFTSPAVTTSIEKVRVRGKYIDPDEFADIVDKLKPFINRAYTECPYGHPSYFEIFLAIALVYFERKKCEWVILEVGLGGRYDATNIIHKPWITVITNVDYDHMEVLGKTLDKIAHDKAGIIKKGSTFFTTEKRAKLLHIFDNICRKKKVPFNLIEPCTDHHTANRALASAIVRHMGISEIAVSEGFNNIYIPCRFELLKKEPFVVLDGAHNRAKIRATVADLSKLNFTKLHLVIGIAESKDHRQILAQIIPRAGRIYFTRFQNPNRKCAHPRILLNLSKKYLTNGAKAEIYLDPHTALTKAMANASKNDLVLVTGSFLLSGELRKRWFPENYILNKRKSS